LLQRTSQAGIEKIDSITKEPVTIPAIIGRHKLPPEESRSQTVFENYHCFRQAFGPRRSYIILVYNVKH